MNGLQSGSQFGNFMQQQQQQAASLLAAQQVKHKFFEMLMFVNVVVFVFWEFEL